MPDYRKRQTTAATTGNTPTQDQDTAQPQNERYEEPRNGPEKSAAAKNFVRRQSRTTKSHPEHVISPFNNVEAEGKVFINEDYEGIKVSDSGTIWFSFTLAVYEGKNQNGGYRDSVWINVVMFKDVAERAEKEISEGAWIRVYGKLAGGNKASNYRIKLIADDFDDKSQ